MTCNERPEHPADVAARLKAMRAQETSQYAAPRDLADAWRRNLRDDAGAACGDVGLLRARLHEAWRHWAITWCYKTVDALGKAA